MTERTAVGDRSADIVFGMPEFPRDVAARTVERERIRARVYADAERLAEARGRTLKCSGYGGGLALHAWSEGGCGNDGTGCLCECHDQAVPNPSPG